jgi:hypothetical protein
MTIILYKVADFGLCSSLRRFLENLLLVFENLLAYIDLLCGLVVRVLGYRFGGTGSIPGTTRKKKVMGLKRGPLSLVSTTEELLDIK